MSTKQSKAVRRLAKLVEQNPQGAKQLSTYSLYKLKYGGSSTAKASNAADSELYDREHAHRTPRKK